LLTDHGRDLHRRMLEQSVLDVARQLEAVLG
jgi:hypothetical protein